MRKRQDYAAPCLAFWFMIAADLLTTLADGETQMAKKTTKLRPWTTDDIRMLKTLAREKTKTTVIARKLSR